MDRVERVGRVERAAALAAELDEAGLLAPGWRPAFEKVRRDQFIPDRIWIAGQGGYRALSRGDDPERWWNAVYADVSVVTQVEDGEHREVSLHPSSSASMPRMVAIMLAELDVGDGHRVLEIGTGTGYNAALLCERLGDRLVTTVEIDHAVADQARAALRRAGYAPTTLTADGADGWPENGPYDRVIATCAVRDVPHAWVAQTRPGGVVVTPWGSAFYNGVLLRLTVGADGTAVGRVVDDSSFMWLRAQRPGVGDVMSHVRDTARATLSRTRLDPRAVSDDDAAFAVGVQVPGCRYTVGWGSGGEADECTLWLADPDTGSWACADYEPGLAEFAVEQYGPRRLWEEVEAAYRWWGHAGRPARERFGLTVTPEKQTVWLDGPDDPQAPISSAVPYRA
ncbi:MAG: methyltransferase domain-containing protein [Streptomycetales bacterium]